MDAMTTAGIRANIADSRARSADSGTGARIRTNHPEIAARIQEAAVRAYRARDEAIDAATPEAAREAATRAEQAADEAWAALRAARAAGKHRA